MATDPVRLGQHTLVEEGDTLVIRMVGPFTMAEAVPLYAIVSRVYATHGRCFLLADVRQMGPLDMPTRRFVAGRPEREIDAVAVFGSNAALRTIAELMFSAIRLMRRRKVAAIDFARDEAAARRWLAEQGARGDGG